MAASRTDGFDSMLLIAAKFIYMQLLFRATTGDSKSMSSAGAAKKEESKLERDCRGHQVGFKKHLVQVASRLCQSWQRQAFDAAKSSRSQRRHCCIETQMRCHSTASSCPRQFIHRTSLRCFFLEMGRKELEFV